MSAIHGAPDLWSTINSNHTFLNINHFPVYLDRSRNRPLRLFLNTTEGERDCESWLDVMEQAMQHADRWHQVSLRLEDVYWYHPTFFAMFCRLKHLSVPNLEAFEIFTHLPHGNAIGDMFPAISSPQKVFQGGAPKLTCLRMDWISLLAYTPTSNISTLQVNGARIKERAFPFDVFLDLLHSPNLVNLSLAGNLFLPPTVLDIAQPVLAGKLENFRFTESIPIARNIWKCLRAPRLELLIMKNVDLDSAWVFPFDVTAIPDDPATILFPSLRSLAVIGCNVSSFDCARALSLATKNVTHLYVCHKDWGRSPANFGMDIITKMAKNSSALWPRLETLTSFIRMDVPKEENSESEDDEMENAEHIQANFNTFYAFIENYSRIMKRHFTLRLWGTDANFWEETSPETWQRLVEGGIFEQLEFEGDIVPWPPRNSQHNFTTSSEYDLLSFTGSI